MGGNHYQALEFIQNTEANDLTVAVQFSDTPDFAFLNVSVPFSSESVGDNLERVVVRSGNVLSEGGEFSRLFVATEEIQN
jgi:hypothetical protein